MQSIIDVLASQAASFCKKMQDKLATHPAQ